MASSMTPLPPFPGPSMSVDALHFDLDLSCPLLLAPRAATGTPWPYATAGPSSSSSESPTSFVKRRYLETLYLSDLLFPIHHFAQDLARLGQIVISECIEPRLLPLTQIEYRHRKTLLPVLAALISASAVTTATPNLISTEALDASGLHQAEQDVLKVAVELISGCKAMDEGGVVQAKQLSVELEKRETLLQVALLFFYLSHIPSPSPPVKKRKRKHDRGTASVQTVIADPAASLELLMDRVSVWSAVAELGIGANDNADPKGKRKEDGVQAILRRFWDDVIVPFFSAAQPDLCQTFHLKVFGSLPPAPLVPPTTTKKPRKPRYTRARPSSDALTQPEPNVVQHPFRRPSDASSRPPLSVHGDQEHEHSMERQLGRTMSRQRSESQSLEMRRSRSRSVDPGGTLMEKDNLLVQPRRGLSRQPSGKDLFKGRQVGLMRRTSSVIARKGRTDSQSASQSQSQMPRGLGRNESMSRIGLLGRKTSDPKRRDSGESQNTQYQPPQSVRPIGTLIHATPSKPRFNSFRYSAPTPIAEEPSSAERPSYITETPVAHGRIAHTSALSGRVLDTPIGQLAESRESESGRRFGEMLRSLDDTVEEREEDDNLGELMVMTDDEGDDEDDGEEDSRRGLVPETPSR